SIALDKIRLAITILVAQQRQISGPLFCNTSHPGRNSWEAAQVYPRANTADQKSGGARQERRGNCRVGRRDRWFAASHLLQVGHQSAATPFQDRNRPAAAKRQCVAAIDQRTTRAKFAVGASGHGPSPYARSEEHTSELQARV